MSILAKNQHQVEHIKSKPIPPQTSETSNDFNVPRPILQTGNIEQGTTLDIVYTFLLLQSFFTSQDLCCLL
jgi:hypothetical protein